LHHHSFAISAFPTGAGWGAGPGGRTATTTVLSPVIPQKGAPLWGADGPDENVQTTHSTHSNVTPPPADRVVGWGVITREENGRLACEMTQSVSKNK